MAGGSQPISRRQLDDLRQRPLGDPQSAGTRPSRRPSCRLFMRQLIRPQLGFQRRLTTGFAREAALLAAQRDDHPLRKLFKGKTGLDVREFIDLSLATYSRIFDGEREIPDTWFTSIRTTYAIEVISSFQKSVARTLPELVALLPLASRRQPQGCIGVFRVPGFVTLPVRPHGRRHDLLAPSGVLSGYGEFRTFRAERRRPRIHAAFRPLVRAPRRSGSHEGADTIFRRRQASRVDCSRDESTRRLVAFSPLQTSSSSRRRGCSTSPRWP